MPANGMARVPSVRPGLRDDSRNARDGWATRDRPPGRGKTRLARAAFRATWLSSNRQVQPRSEAAPTTPATITEAAAGKFAAQSARRLSGSVSPRTAGCWTWSENPGLYHDGAIMTRSAIGAAHNRRTRRYGDKEEPAFLMEQATRNGPQGFYAARAAAKHAAGVHVRPSVKSRDRTHVPGARTTRHSNAPRPQLYPSDAPRPAGT